MCDHSKRLTPSPDSSLSRRISTPARPTLRVASVAFRLILPGPQQVHYRSLMTQWVHDGRQLLAPTLWVCEMTSALCKAVRLGELSREAGQRALGLAQALGIELMHPDDNQVRLAFEWTVSLNRAAAYDSFYLALAETLGCELWTADKRLTRAVNRPWVHWAGKSIGEPALDERAVDSGQD